MKEIPLTQGKVAMVDDEDFDRVNQFKWCVRSGHNTWYACRNLPRAFGGQIQRLHRFLLPGVKAIDHVDGDGLNNQKSNLRPANRSQNSANQKKQSGTYSKFKGVTWDKRKRYRCWLSAITVNYKRQHLGYFEDETDAAHVYDYAAKIYFGEFARLNFPE